MYTIHKAAGVIIKDRKLLVAREYGKQIFVSPGGAIRNDESSIRSLLRELQEEVGIIANSSDLEPLGNYSAMAANDPDKTVSMEVFRVNHWAGEIAPGKEIEEVAWVTSGNPQKIILGSIFEHDVIPDLKKKDLID